MPPDAAADRAVNAQADRFAAVLGPLLAPGEPFALLDFPDHSNIGDSAIWAGELAFLDAHAGRPPSYVASLGTYRGDVDAFCPEGPILLHGGGNFGDVWPEFHALRLDVLDRYRHRRVIQLPQSLHFDNPSAIDATARRIAAHGRFTLLVRDEPSRDLARRRFDCEVALCPDAAYNLHRIETADGAVPVLSLLRGDKEGAAGAARRYLEGVGPVIDWRWPPWSRWRRPLVRRWAERAAGPRLPRSRLLMRAREQVFRAQALAMVAAGVGMLRPGRTVVSDRLHAHILASLMRRPHVMLDNSYGKVARYLAAWGDDGLAAMAAGPGDLRARVEAARAGATGAAGWAAGRPLPAGQVA